MTINSAKTLTVDNRCRGLLLFVDGDLTVNGTLSMTARGCKANPATSGTDSDTPVAPGDGNAVGTNGIRFPFLTAAGSDTLAAAELNGTGTALQALIASFPALSSNGDIIAFPKVGGAGAVGTTSGVNGTAGSTNQTGGGGTGGPNTGTAGSGVAGTCFSGGGGGGGAYTGTGGSASPYGGIGGSCNHASGGAGAGNPRGTVGVDGGTGTGGFIMVICSGTITVGASGIISSNGAHGGDGGAAYGTGGGSGGGAIGLIYVTAYSNSGTVQALGGPKGDDTYWPAGDGGAGTIQTLQISA